jgi:hypothetical protein
MLPQKGYIFQTPSVKKVQTLRSRAHTKSHLRADSRWIPPLVPRCSVALLPWGSRHGTATWCSGWFPTIVDDKPSLAQRPKPRTFPGTIRLKRPINDSPPSALTLLANESAKTGHVRFLFFLEVPVSVLPE